jgi:hypothetical protein
MSVKSDCGGRTLAQVYERLKWACRHNATGTLDGVAAEAYRKADAAYAEVKAAPFGTFAGGTFFGAQGVWITNYAANQVFQLIDDSGTTQSPPNTVFVEVSALVSGDRVGVFKLDTPGGDIERDTYTVSLGNQYYGGHGRLYCIGHACVWLPSGGGPWGVHLYFMVG